MILSSDPPRLSVRAVVIEGQEILVQRGAALVDKPSEPSLCYAFIGGGYEPGDTFEYRLQKEFEEETNAQVTGCEMLFVVENRRLQNEKLLQSVDVFFLVSLDRHDVQTRESHITQHWLPVPSLRQFDLRPWAVRDVIAERRHLSVRHIVVPLDQ